MDIEKALAFTDALVFAKLGVHLSDLQQAMLRESWSWQRQSYDQIADSYGYSPTYLKHDIGPKLWKLLSEVLKEKVNKTSFRAAIERRFLVEGTPPQEQLEPPSVLSQEQTRIETPSQVPNIIENEVATIPRQDWGDVHDIRFFHGRQQELASLQEWILVERCRLVALLGLGGMGKTSLSVKLAQELQSQFEVVIWRSLRNAPSVQEILTQLLQFLSNQQEIDFPKTVEGKISRLLDYLRSQRCLLVFDNFETILLGGDTPDLTGNYCEGYEGYGELLRRVGESIHQSCLILTSREQPQEIRLLEGNSLPVRSLQLGGLKKTEGQELLRLKGDFQATEAEWSELIDYYSGNPLALKIISTTIQHLFDGSISDFVQQDAFVFGNIRHLIEQQLQRISESEKTVIYWLAIYRVPASFSDLRADIFPPISPQKLLEVLESLEQRCLIEKSAAQFSLQPVVMEYLTTQFVEQISQEVQMGLALKPQKNPLFKSHVLLKAQAKDYVRETQVRFILKPVCDRLLTDLAGQSTLEEVLTQILQSLRGKTPLEIGYAGGNILNLLCQQQRCLSDYDFSDLTIWQAYLPQVNLHHLNFVGADLSKSVFAETLGIIWCVAFSPDGKLLATGDAEGGLRLWQVANGQLLLNFEGHVGWVWSVAFHPDGQTLASCSSDKTIRLWDARTGECLKILQGHTSSIWSVAFSPDGQRIASGGDEPTVRLWDTSTGECRHLAGHTGRIITVAFSPISPTTELNGNQSTTGGEQILASGSEDSTLRLWSVDTGECLAVCDSHTDRVWSVAFSSDGVTLASGSADRTIRLWSVSSGECVKILQLHKDAVRSVAFSPNAEKLISASGDRTVRVWDVSTLKCQNILQGHTNAVFSVAVNADGQIASGSTDQTVKFWNLETGQCLKTLKGYTNSVFSVAFNPDGRKIASGSTDQTVRLWDISTGEYQNLAGHQDWVYSVTFHPDGHLVASSSVDQTIRLWSVSTGHCLNILQGHTDWVLSVAFSPAGEILASGSDDRTIRLWSVSTGQCLNTFNGHSNWVWCVTFSPQGHTLASSSEDQTIRLWSVTTGECLHILDGHSSRVQSIAFSPDGQTLSSGSGDGTVRLWSVSTGECFNIFTGHSNNVWSVAFSSDGSILASASLDQTVRIWDISTGTCLKTLSVFAHSVRSAIAFSPALTKAKHHTLASGSQDGTILIWDVETGQCLTTLSPDKPYKGTNITGVTGITAAQKAAFKALGAIEK
ncbi:MAG: NB-ARC domain-containing protein [Rhizonema sp. PD38]|nr:NB-ARC domain-containing protein [Rhizonema sp. PD38]